MRVAANRSPEEWQRLVTAWRASGMACKAFASELGVHPHTLSWWAWRLGSRSLARDAVRPGRTGSLVPTARARAPGFVEVVVSDAPSTVPCDFVLEVRDLRVRVPHGFDAGELRRLLGALC